MMEEIESKSTITANDTGNILLAEGSTHKADSNNFKMIQ